MKTIFLLLITINLSAQKTGIFPYSDGKIVISKIFPITKNVGYTAKSKLALYANNYNGGISQETNKMKDYVFYEDSNMVSSVIKLHTSQTLQESIFQGVVEFRKQGDSVVVTIKDIKLEKASNAIAGTVTSSVDNQLENLDQKKFSGLLKKLKERIDYFYSL